MAETRASIEQKFLEAFSANMTNPVNMDKLGVGFKAFMDAAKVIQDDGLMVYDTSKPYGIVWDEVNDTYYRVGHSVPVIQQQMRRVVCVGNPNWEGSVYKYLDANDSTKYEDGTSSVADIGGYGSRQVFVEVPKCYWKNYKVGNLMYFMMSQTPATGYTTHDRFRKSGWADSGDGTNSVNEFEYAYLTAFEGSLYDASATAYVDGTGSAPTLDLGADAIRSVVGFKPCTVITRAQGRTLIANGGGKQHSWHEHTLIRQLFLIEYMTHDSQSVIPGYTEKTSGGGYANSVVITGVTTSLGNKSGSITGKPSDFGGTDTGVLVIANSYRGIENFFGHLWQWVDGINVNSAVPYICKATDTFADDTSSGVYIRATDFDGTDIAQPTSNGYQAKIFSNFLIKLIGASSVSKVTDYYWYNSGALVLRSGSYLNTSSSAGVGCLGFSLASSDAGWHVVAR
jgi:hypothetical protein